MAKLTQKQKRAQEKKRKQKHNAITVTKKSDSVYYSPESILGYDPNQLIYPDPPDLKEINDDEDEYNDDEYDGYNLWSEEDKAIERELDRIIDECMSKS